MMKTKLPITYCLISILIAILFTNCGGDQKQQAALETRPLEETKAHEIIKSVLHNRGYSAQRDVPIKLATNTQFNVDFSIKGHAIVIEYLTEQDNIKTGQLPPKAESSRLHVLPGRLVSADPNKPSEPIYIYIIDAQKYIYQYNPTTEHRADVTFLEVDSRLRRDLADFLSWHESQLANKK